MGGANYAVLLLSTAYANDSQPVIMVSSHFKFVLIVVVHVGFVSKNFCTKVVFSAKLKTGRENKMPFNYLQLNMLL